MLDLYKQAYEKMAVPQELIDKTAVKMRQIQNGNKKPERLFGYAQYAALAAACLIVVILIPSLLKITTNESSIFVTALSKGRHVENVKLKNGDLTFQNEDEGLILIPPLNLGNSGIISEQWSSEEYMRYLGLDIKLGYLPKGMVKSEESATVSTSKDGKIISDKYTMGFERLTGSKNEERLDITVSKGKLPLQCNLSREENSVIKGNALTVGVSSGNDVYWAQFMYNGAGYYIETSNVSQEEFIKIVYGMFE